MRKYTIFLQENSPYLPLVNVKLLEMLMTGHLGPMMSKAMPNATSCNTLTKIFSSHDSMAFTALNLGHTYSLFLLVAGALSAACIVFAVELGMKTVVDIVNG